MELEKAKEILNRIDVKFFLNGSIEQNNYIIEKANEINIAIETVLQALEEKERLYIKTLVKGVNETIENREKNNTELELLNEGWKIREKELLEELETYKKIAEKLSSKLNEAYFEQNDFWLFFEKEILKGIEADYGYVGDVIIDWARKEVEKDE